MKDYSALIDSINRTLENYVFQAFEIIEEHAIKAAESFAGISMSYPNPRDNNDQLQTKNGFLIMSNRLLSRILKIKRLKHSEEFKHKLETLKKEIDEMLTDKATNEMARLDKVVPVDLYNTISTLLEKFDTFYLNFSKQLSLICDKNREKNYKKLPKRFTDFSSDTESQIASKFVSKQRCKKIFSVLKSKEAEMKIENEFNDDEFDEVGFDNQCEKLYYSDSDVGNIEFMDRRNVTNQYQNNNDLERQQSGYESDCENSDSDSNESNESNDSDDSFGENMFSNNKVENEIESDLDREDGKNEGNNEKKPNDSEEKPNSVKQNVFI